MHRKIKEIAQTEEGRDEKPCKITTNMINIFGRNIQRQEASK